MILDSVFKPEELSYLKTYICQALDFYPNQIVFMRDFVGHNFFIVLVFCGLNEAFVDIVFDDFVFLRPMLYFSRYI